MSGSKDILIANLRAEIAAGRAGEESSAEERRVVGQLLDELLPKRIAEAESYGYDNGFRDGLRARDVDALRERAERAGALRDEAEQRADVCHANHEGGLRDLRERLLTAERERDEAREALRVARTDRDREAHDRQTTSDAWNDMRRQRDAALVERNAAIEQAKHVGACLVERSARAEKAERERDALRHHYDKAGPEHNLLALLDMYDERRVAAESERDEARAERDARPDISAEDASRIMGATLWLAPGEHDDHQRAACLKIAGALRAHAQKAVKP